MADVFVDERTAASLQETIHKRREGGKKLTLWSGYGIVASSRQPAKEKRIALSRRDEFTAFSAGRPQSLGNEQMTIRHDFREFCAAAQRRGRMS